MINEADRLGEISPDCRLFFMEKGGMRPMTQGRIHSLESMGLVDGPGIRSVVFLQGCALCCLYCHNPDTWAADGPAETVTPRQLTDRLLRYRPYYGDRGGVTFSGGEPLLQQEFLAECLALCQEAGLHTCLDTAGCGLGEYGAILAHTDLILLDVKHYTPEGWRKVTGSSMEPFSRFLAAAQQAAVPLWVRHVVAPGLTDGDAHLTGLEEYLKTIRYIERVELLPYHTLGVHKYAALGLPYPLEGVPPMDGAALEQWNERLNRSCASGNGTEEKESEHEH